MQKKTAGKWTSWHREVPIKTKAIFLARNIPLDERIEPGPESDPESEEVQNKRCTNSQHRIDLEPGLNLLSQPSLPLSLPLPFCLAETVNLRGRPAGKRRIVVSPFLLALNAPSE